MEKSGNKYKTQRMATETIEDSKGGETSNISLKGYYNHHYAIITRIVHHMKITLCALSLSTHIEHALSKHDIRRFVVP